jgi:hypothetical protein
MTALTRTRRITFGLWILIAVVVWNGLYDLRITLGVRDYLLKQALHQAGQGPAVTISDAMRETVRDAVMVATLWASIILCAGLWTIRALGRKASAP